jgi:hypothetical protein
MPPPDPFKMGASNGPLSLILFIICISDLNGLEAVIITTKSRFRVFEFGA